MYSVSQDYLTALSKPAKVRRITGTIGNRAVTEANFTSGGLKISNACSEGTEVKIGSVYMGTLEAVVVGVDFLNNWYGKVVTLSEGLLVGPDTWEDVPLGIYRVVEANHADDGVHITAYDDMRRCHIRRWTHETFVGQPWDYLQEICNIAHVTLANTENEIRALPNGLKGFSLYPENDITTCRDMLHWVTQTLGCIATINRAGQLELRPYGDYQNPIATIGSGTRWRGGSISDFETYYTELTYDDIQSGEQAYFGEEEDDGLTYELGANPLLQYYGTEPVDHPAWDILDALQAIRFTPFNIDMAACPAYDLCDVIQFSNVREGWSPIGCIMGYEYQFHGAYTLHGFGSNPALNNVKSPEQKALVGLRNQGKGNTIQYYTFTNGRAVNVASEYTDIAHIRFATVSETLAVFELEAKIDVDTQDIASATVLYQYNDDVIEYTPQETWIDGNHLLHLMYYFTTEGGVENELRVKLKLEDGTGLIDAQNIHAMIWGQGLVASDKWDGLIEREDNVELIDSFATSPTTIDYINGTATVNLISDLVLSFSDGVDDTELSTAPEAMLNFDGAPYINKKAVYDLYWSDVYDLSGGWEELYEDYNW